jgi:soluble P-type ATPase
MDTSLPRGILIDIPGRGSLHVTHLILDFNGTIAKDGALLPAVEERLNQLSQQLEVIVLTADTYGTASQVLSHLPVKLKVISTGEDKKKLLTVILKKNNSSSIAAIGNGSNDAAMLRHADLGIAVFGPEGTPRDTSVSFTRSKTTSEPRQKTTVTSTPKFDDIS